ncbi:hypothetical protein R6Z07F_019925 [Ovis aries]
MWNLPASGIKPMSPALAGSFLTTGPPGKSLLGERKNFTEIFPVICLVPGGAFTERGAQEEKHPPLRREEEPFPNSQESLDRFPFGEREETLNSELTGHSPLGHGSGSLLAREPTPSATSRPSLSRCRIDSAPQRAPGPAEPTPCAGPGPAMPSTAAAVAAATAGTATAATAAGPGPGWGLESPQWG